MEFTGYLKTDEGKARFPAGRFPRRVSAVRRRHPSIMTQGDMTRITNYLRLKEPWRYEE